MKRCVMYGGDEFGTFSSSWRDGNNELIYRINSGDDARLADSN